MKERTRIGLLLLLAIGLGALLEQGDCRQSLRETARQISDRGKVRGYMKTHAVRRLQLGAGGNDPGGWLNSDIAPTSTEIYLDATRPFPFPDASFQYVFSEHVIEHVSWEGGLAMLRECHRVLAPGGKLRTVTPNLKKFMQLVEDGTSPANRKYIETKLRYHLWPSTPVPAVYILNREAHDWGHQFLYDPETLRKSLELAGFQQIREYPVSEKTDPVFGEAEIRTRNPESDLYVVNDWEAMAFEATR